ncbi:hypothetical protein D3C74_159940 [compost metagenome]
MNLAQDYREEMAYWLGMKMDADLRGDEVTSKFAVQCYRASRDKLLTLWRDQDAG